MTFSYFSSDLEPVLGPDTITTDFLGKLREMTGGEMVAVTRDVKKYSKSEKESKGKLRKVNTIKSKLSSPRFFCPLFHEFDLIVLNSRK